MSGRRVAAMTRRIVAQFRRDRRTLALLFVVPIVLVALVGWVLRDQQSTATRIALVNEDPAAGTLVTGTLRQLLTEGGVAVTVAADEATARQEIVDGSVDLALVVPPGMSAQIAAGGAPTIRIVTEGDDPASDAGRVASIQRALATAMARMSHGGVLPPNIERATVYGSANADTLDTLAPVFVGFFAYFFVFILTGISFLRERVGGTLERLLATPVTRGEIVLGYSLGFGLFATIQVALVMACVLGQIHTPAIGPIPELAIGLGVHIAGNPLLAYLLVLVLGLGAVSLGIFLSTFARTELQILPFIPLVIVPQGLLGGIFWTVDQLPEFLQPIARVLPVTYAIEGLRQIMIAGADLSSSIVLVDLGVLVAVAAIFDALASTTIRREVA